MRLLHRYLADVQEQAYEEALRGKPLEEHHQQNGSAGMKTRITCAEQCLLAILLRVLSRVGLKISRVWRLRRQGPSGAMGPLLPLFERLEHRGERFGVGGPGARTGREVRHISNESFLLLVPADEDRVFAVGFRHIESLSRPWEFRRVL